MPPDKHKSLAVEEEFLRRREQIRIAPGPSGDDVKDWMQDGVEELFGFFNSTADIWDRKFGVELDDPFYNAVAERIPQTDQAIDILDLGCGTGIQLEFVFSRAPNARVTAVDRAPNMLGQLETKFREKVSQLRLVEGSVLEIPFGNQEYDYAISVLTMPHFLPDQKVSVYRKVREALRSEGAYIEGDQSDAPGGEEDTLYWFNRWIAKLPGGDQGEWNFDISLPVEMQTRLLLQSGFSEVQVAWNEPSRGAVHVARATFNRCGKRERATLTFLYSNSPQHRRFRWSRAWKERVAMNLLRPSLAIGSAVYAHLGNAGRLDPIVDPGTAAAAGPGGRGD